MQITFLTWRDTGHPDGGGSEVYVEEVARRLVRRGHVVTVRSAAYDGAPSSDVLNGVAHRRAGGRLSVYVRGLIFLLSRYGRQQDVIVDVINGIPFAAPLVRRRGVVALVHHLHREQWAIIYPNWKGRLGWFVESKVCPRLYRGLTFITVSNHSAADLCGIGIDAARVTVVPNGLPHDVPRATAEKAPVPRLCVLSRLVPHKQIEHALEVLAALAVQIPDLQLDIVGQGWWRDRLVARAAEFGVTSRVTFHGYLPDAERDHVIARAWLMLLPSVKEGWGIAVTEAARQGTPSIGYRSSGGLVESVCDEVTGLLVDDIDDMTQAVLRLLTSPERLRSMSVAAAQRAEVFDWDTTAERFEEALRSRVAVG